MQQNFIYQRELYRYLLDRDWNVFGTLKFQPVRRISNSVAHMQLRYFWNKLDRVIYGKAAETGCRVNRWCFAHAGSHSDNYHLHFVAHAPVDQLEFCALANTLWAKISPETAGIYQNWITPVLHPDRVAGYVTREVWKLGPASFDTMISADTRVTYRLQRKGPAWGPAVQALLTILACCSAVFRCEHRGQLCYDSKTTCCVNRANHARNGALRMAMITGHCVTPLRQPAVLTRQMVPETRRSACQ